MTAVLVTFMIVFSQWGAQWAICLEWTSTESQESSLVLVDEMDLTCCDLSQCAPLCQLTSQEKPFSLQKNTYQRLVNPIKVAPVLNRLNLESFSPAHFLWPATVKAENKPGVEVYLLNTSFLI